MTKRQTEDVHNNFKCLQFVKVINIKTFFLCNLATDALKPTILAFITESGSGSHCCGSLEVHIYHTVKLTVFSTLRILGYSSVPSYLHYPEILGQTMVIMCQITLLTFISGPGRS